MPELQRQLFDPRTLPSTDAPKPQGGGGVPDAGWASRTPQEGQLVMQFGPHDYPETEGGFRSDALSTGGVLPVTHQTDGMWDKDAWKIGGVNRQKAESGFFAENDPVGVAEAKGVVRKWESMPVTRIPANRELRSGQVTEPDEDPDWTPEAWPDEFMETALETEHVDALRSQPVFRDAADPDVDFNSREDGYPFSDAEEHANDVPRTGPARYPWVARVKREGDSRDYVLEGNHRVAAMRTRGTGEVQAYLFEGNERETLPQIARRFKEESRS